MTQAKTSYICGYVQPSGQSNQRLGCGVYSLSARSNVPFVRIQGRTVDKTITWGEIAEVPFGELCSVTNASWHGGDIFINGGCDYDNKPARITVPVPFAQGVGILVGQWVPGYPADVRTARRAYLCFDATSPAADPSIVTVLGQRFDGSHNTSNEIDAALGIPGAGYIDSHAVPLNTLIGIIPLGHLALLGGDGRPHTLLTTALPVVENNVILGPTIPPVPPLTTPNAYYTMEY